MNSSRVSGKRQNAEGTECIYRRAPLFILSILLCCFRAHMPLPLLFENMHMPSIVLPLVIREIKSGGLYKDGKLNDAIHTFPYSISPDPQALFPEVKG